jgi:hypothetical protein
LTLPSQVLHEYKRYLVLKVIASDFDDEAIAASSSVLQMWREHIVDTAAYADLCRTLCGRTIHHAPDKDMGLHAQRCHRTQFLYRKHFREEPPPAIWDFGELGSLSLAEAAEIEAEIPSNKRKRGSTSLVISVQAPQSPLVSLTVSSDSIISQVFDQ